MYVVEVQVIRIGLGASYEKLSSDKVRESMGMSYVSLVIRLRLEKLKRLE